jgi:hypothetical protein
VLCCRLSHTTVLILSPFCRNEDPELWQDITGTARRLLAQKALGISPLFVGIRPTVMTLHSDPHTRCQTCQLGRTDRRSPVEVNAEMRCRTGTPSAHPVTTLLYPINDVVHYNESSCPYLRVTERQCYLLLHTQLFSFHGMCVV